MSQPDWPDLLARHGIAVPPERHAEFTRNHQDLRALVALVQSTPLAAQPWTPPPSLDREGAGA
ncbi:hypothetical protein [Xylophilus sp. GOD-11R]|uniref:hypothetical protein n=1 Tax=Xylophilus sp. GOD-11R TaxID=3089814 RepID=UPI00298C5D1B|nr:hypothetical protein [Xylophilus sp. GOD-11R]WPB58260.1 hypothetical protein R9X41_06355 [Xylophilus sp. GOD-11R]